MFEQERKNSKAEAVKKLTEKLEKEITEGLKNFNKLSKLSATISDGRIIQDEMIMVFGVDPKNIALLATEEDADQILKHVRVDDEVVEADKMPDGSVCHREYFEEAKDHVERAEWIKKPV